MKRSEQSRYVIPALRHKSNECENEMEDKIEDRHASESAIQTYFFGRHGSLRKRYTNIVPRKVRFDISTFSNPTSASNESSKEEDSSDFEDCCSDIVDKDNLRMGKGTTEDFSNDLWKKGSGDENTTQSEHNIEIRNFGVNTKSSNKLLMIQKDCADPKYLSRQELESGSNEKELNRDLFFNYGDSNLSDIEAVIDSYTKKANVLTSTSKSDIVEERVLDAARYVTEEEKSMESTLLGESEKQTTTITNRNYSDYNFEIFDGPSLARNQPKDCSEVFDYSYISPPVPPTYIFKLPPIHRLPSPVPSTYKLYVEHLASQQPSVPHPALIRPTGPRTASFQPSAPSAISPQPQVHRAVSPQLCIPRAASPQPCITRVVSPQPCIPRVVSPQPCVPRVVSPQPCVPRAVSPQPCVPGSVLLETHQPYSPEASKVGQNCLQPSAFHPTFIQPPIPRPVSPQLSESNSGFPHHTPHTFTQLHYPRVLRPPSPQLYPDSPQYQADKSPKVQHTTRYSLSPCIRLLSNPNSSEPLYNASLSTLLPRSSMEGDSTLHSYQDKIHLPNLTMNDQDTHFYIPPPVPPPWIETKSADLLS